MLALMFRVNTAAYAVPARDVVEVLPLCKLRSVAHVPPVVIGLLAFRGVLVPVVDVNLLLGSSHDSNRHSSRIIVLSVPLPVEVSTTDSQLPARSSRDSPIEGRRLLALQADSVTDLVRSEAQLSGLNLSHARYLGEHLVDLEELPQLLRVESLLPLQLSTLFFDANAPTPAEALEVSDAGGLSNGRAELDHGSELRTP